MLILAYIFAILAVACFLTLTAGVVYVIWILEQREDNRTPTIEAIERGLAEHTLDGARGWEMEHSPAQREAFDNIREKLNP